MRRVLSLGFSVLATLVSASASAKPAGDLLERLPGHATIAFGINREGSEADLAKVLEATFAPLLGEVHAPACAFAVFAKVEALAGTVDTSATPPRVTVAARGAGLRPALERCLRDHAAGLAVGRQGPVTRYGLGDDRAHVVWLDDATLVLGPLGDAAATAALVRVAAPAARDRALQGLLAHVDTRGPLWIVVDGAAFERPWRANAPRPRAAWAALDGLDLVVTLAMASPADAATIAGGVRDLVRQNPSAAVVTVVPDGAQARIQLPVGKLLAQRIGGDPRAQRPTVVALATLGIVGAVAVPAYMKAVRDAGDR